ncbi:MAG: hypothetical protein KDK03_19400 [Rhodobacteraceae bacterium]|nr:hypothetical protein [Paracoccaceae bacterium]
MHTRVKASTRVAIGVLTTVAPFASEDAKTCKTVADCVTVPQNRGQNEVLTTLRSYGQISRERQRVLITGEVQGDILE